MEATENLKEAVSKLSGALYAVESANELLARMKDEVKDMELNPTAIIYGIKRNKMRNKNPENIELQDEMYETIWDAELL